MCRARQDIHLISIAGETTRTSELYRETQLTGLNVDYHVIIELNMTRKLEDGAERSVMTHVDASAAPAQVTSAEASTAQDSVL